VYLNVNGTASGDTGLNGTSKLPIVDYASIGKSAVEENKRLTSQIQVLQSRITILQGGGKVTIDSQNTTTNLPIVDYKAKVDELQKQIDALTAQLKGKPIVKATSKPTSKTTAKAGVPSTAKATAKATSSRGNYSQSQRQKWQARISATPKPTKSQK
jgi:ribosomal protein L12E/L44/L45/RPP1/RPP2